MTRYFVTILFLLVGTLLPAHAAGDLPYAIPADAFKPPSAGEQAAILAGICDGSVKANACDTCPESPSAGDSFTLKHVIPGHFLSSKSTDAFATISGCEQMHASIGWGFLVTKRAGKWKPVANALGLDLGHCHAMVFQSGREFLVCEDYRMESFQVMHSVTAVFAEPGSIAFRNLLTAADTTQLCDEQPRVQKAHIDKIQFHDLNGDGIADISFTASFGTMADSARRRKLCRDAEDTKSGRRRPEPAATKSYQIDYLFDGRRFTLAEKSGAAAKLFEWEN